MTNIEFYRKLFLESRDRLALLILFCYLLFNYGFMQIRIGILPIGEMFILLMIVITRWLTVTARFYFVSGPSILMLFLSWWLFVALSAMLGFYKYGVWALRDASHVIETIYILIGFCLFGSFFFMNKLFSFFRFFIVVIILYGLTYPISGFLRFLSPHLSGASGQSVSIFFVYTNTAMLMLVSAASMFIFKSEGFFVSKLKLIIAGFLIAFCLAFFQARTIYLQIIALYLFLFMFRRSEFKKGIFVILFGLLVIILLPILGFEAEGRIGQVVSLKFLYNHFMAIFGIANSGVESAAGGVDLRIGWWLDIYEKWSVDFTTMFFGLGFGLPLIDHGLANGVVAREPHNSFISLLARLGIFGASLWCLIHCFLLKVWFNLFKFTKINQYKTINNFLAVFMIYFVFVCVFAIGEDSFEKPFNAIPYYLLWGGVIRMEWYRRKSIFEEVVRSAESKNFNGTQQISSAWR
ncbi:O-antigen ligase family protein [Kistimonas asteriae]|uniref:O-antigen ligase family protein n=1 Tax=Kistimonas asteriae TaxID=517724 RepID=UPI001BA4E6A6|nr:O-antigen ligase family protein [Kistimonas asteriae]